MLVLRFCFLVAIALTIVPLFAFYEPLASIFEAFAPQFSAGSLALGLIFLLRRHRFWALSALLVAAWNAWLVLSTVVGFAIGPTDAPGLKIITFNLFYQNPTLDRSLDYLAKSGADIIAVSEVTPENKPTILAALKASHPYSVDCVDTVRACDVVLLSRLPIRNAFAGNIGGKLTNIARADIDWQGHTISVVAAHPWVPLFRENFPPGLALLPPGEPEAPHLDGAPRLWQSQQAALLARYLAALGPDRLVIGDFNSVPWGSMQKAFRRATGLDNRGHFAPSWTVRLPALFRIPIDHVFVSSGLAVRSFRTGPESGSDHLPIEAEIVLKP